MFMVPGYLMYEIRRLRKKHVLYHFSEHFEPGWTYRYGFLFAGYEPKYAYWEIVVLVRKAAFVLVTVFTRPAGMAAQVMAAVLVLVLSLSMHIHFSPYDHDTHDQLESASLHANLITLPVALLANEMSRVYGTGSTGEGGAQILGPVESLVFSLVAFITFGIFIYLFIHGILMDRVDEENCLGKLSRCICRCWLKKDEQGHVLHFKPSRSKNERRKYITDMAKSHTGADGRAHLIALGIDPDEISEELRRIKTVAIREMTTLEDPEEEQKRRSRSAASVMISKVKVQPILPEEENKDSLPTPPDQRRETDL